ncbi:hypothetical protein VF14_05570 [Nostoc linckia z18]|uniref:Uncharacterized protein n=2 Tax=Nostoc linckia TaxID=92942 RepID=A0A9Q5Z5T3_NOSLI|nr:hypothetical protein [Nostoc linckia]PHK40773.1 hypothetical protein VF13_32410 [Nostoc linckia z16]PHK41901.1 hypothetical protein VF12_04635 [Nostoc linckia z15]PHJ67473.1 hypothetical protein VF02_04590 [Nostoc linckia z1]PHJ72497.1 hypothetical protein VF05_03550 [Nostoc linckia z3]PHJ74839.1 hypothetical protein VF03_12365 [Nostoc linckia z2]
MAFSNYKTISEVLKEFQIIYTESDFIKESEFNIPDYFREDLAIVMREGVVDNSEFAICENLIYPVLKEVWKKYSSKFTLWSHEALNYDEKLSGFPEYLLARRSPLGKVVFDKPYFILVEAKQDNFEAGWAQCLAEMIAAQRLNEEMTITIFGIVSNGDRWQFANLNAQVFTRNITLYSIQELDKLFAAVNYLFQQCQLQLENLVSA